MISTPQTLYKLIILYFLDSVDFSLSNAIISEYILGKGYTDYFTIQKSLSELEEEKLIESSSTHKSTYYTITDDGKQTLDCFHYEISQTIKDEIKNYLKDHFTDIIDYLSVVSDYERVRKNEYLVTCKLLERDTLIASVSLTVTTEEAAQDVCNNWSKNNAAVYAYLCKNLM